MTPCKSLSKDLIPLEWVPWSWIGMWQKKMVCVEALKALVGPSGTCMFSSLTADMWGSHSSRCSQDWVVQKWTMWRIFHIIQWMQRIEHVMLRPFFMLCSVTLFRKRWWRGELLVCLGLFGKTLQTLGWAPGPMIDHYPKAVIVYFPLVRLYRKGWKGDPLVPSHQGAAVSHSSGPWDTGMLPC